MMNIIDSKHRYLRSILVNVTEVFGMGMLFCVLMLVFVSCRRDEVVAPGSDKIPPARPQQLSVAEAMDGYVWLEWKPNSESDLAGYILWRGEEDGPMSVIDTVEGSSFFDTGLSYDTTYAYCLTAIDKSGNVSKASDTVRARPVNKYAPYAPEVIYVYGHNDDMPYFDISWSPSTSVDLAGYRVYRSLQTQPREDPSHVVFTTEASQLRDTIGVMPGTVYYYCVTAVDRGAKESDASNAGHDYITAKPELLTPSDGALTPSWLTFQWRSAAGAGQYRLFVSTLPYAAEIWSKTIDAGSADTLEVMYDGNVLTVGRMYYWRVATITKNSSIPNAISQPRMFQVVN
jgi:hypothetical protein